MEKINIAELLKDCPTGMELDCTNYDGVVKFDGFNKSNPYAIRISVMHDGEVTIHNLTKYGQTLVSSYNKCIIFPKGKTTWEGFVPPCKLKSEPKFKDGDILSYQCEGFKNRTIYIYRYHKTMNTSYYVALSGDIDSEFMVNYIEGSALNGYNDTARLATEEEKEKLFQAIKEHGRTWNAETKTLEELAEPKFHKGDWITCEELNTAKILTINVDKYEVEFIDGNKGFPHIDYIDRNFHLWTIQDAKDGDVLFHSDSASNGIFIFKEILQRGTIQKVICYCDYDSEDGFCLGENHTCCWTDSKILHPATKEQCNLLSQKIKEAGYKWNEETKTLEKLVQPKFKIGDKVKRRHTGETYVIDRVNSNGYFFKNEGGVGFRFEDEWLYELVPNKFDITTLVPFESVVLVRDCNCHEWDGEIFTRHTNKTFNNCHFVTLGGRRWKQCIPYNDDTKHLLGKTDDCDDFYKNW